MVCDTCGFNNPNCADCGGFRFPFVRYARSHIGLPVAVFAGPNKMRLDIHLSLLATVSLLFRNLPADRRQAIYLPEIAVQDLHALFDWLYEDRAPQYTTTAGLLPLMRLWIAASALGMHQYQNAVLRIASGLFERKDAVIDIEPVAYVYRNTSVGSPLRGFAIAVFVQRAPLKAHFFNFRYVIPGLWQDALAFVKMLDNVRRDNMMGVEGYNLHDICDVLFNPVTGQWNYSTPQGVTLDWSKVIFTLPDNVIYGKNWEQMPDNFFVSAENSAAGAEEAGKQIAV
ncbi:uncharacterized protein BDR25DRAFT_371676 [Lindgomyces ingoldianus]|uniref:Uncharacterized protein n=1 Tax=Lindgomyces ingoldianus TaxID=673940 RepID=A0ACB6QTM4_9PLEO|nr:uncharacterized protein BDR25DRAFT_371676 [Lindgomyces ingoldianus]KAF2469647.1 hypothetical protein BDR25DRAFT_371676 [Lindgomyces ingoldianus]